MIAPVSIFCGAFSLSTATVVRCACPSITLPAPPKSVLFGAFRAFWCSSHFLCLGLSHPPKFLCFLVLFVCFRALYIPLCRPSPLPHISVLLVVFVLFGALYISFAFTSSLPPWPQSPCFLGILVLFTFPCVDLFPLPHNLRAFWYFLCFLVLFTFPAPNSTKKQHKTRAPCLATC